ncbi:MAG TPA: serine/threonine-protein kinase [Gemmatimonadaceae bacterium]
MQSELEQVRARLGGRYVIERELGRGGMGAVYLARDVKLDRPVALKVLPAEFASRGLLRDRFLRETRTAASFSHPNIVPVYAVEEAEDFLAYAMAFVEGESVADRVRRAGPLSIRETVRLLQDAGYALAYAHGRGVVHRDIKPDNIMIERATGRALVMDFGIARVIESAPALSGTRGGLTRLGEVVGTPEYMSPEQATGDHVDGRSDLYSLGLTAFFALTGAPAVTGETTGKILARQIADVLPPMKTRRPDLPPPLADAIDRCIAKDPNQRFANAEGLVEALDAAQLAAPEIPIAIRLFGQDLGKLSLITVLGAFMITFMFRAVNPNNVDSLLPAFALIGVVITIAMQTVRESRRLRLAGFTSDEIVRGLNAVLAERQARRDELRADPAVRQARKRSILWAIVLFAAGVIAIVLVRQFRHPVTGAPGHYYITNAGFAFVLAGMVLIGFSLPLLLRSPFKMALPERLFRRVWLGPFGRGVFALAGLGRAKLPGTTIAPGTTTTRPTPVTQTPTNSVSGPVVSTPDVTRLETRVAALERWRESVEAREGVDYGTS